MANEELVMQSFLKKNSRHGNCGGFVVPDDMARGGSIVQASEEEWCTWQMKGSILQA